MTARWMRKQIGARNMNNEWELKGVGDMKTHCPPNDHHSTLLWGVTCISLPALPYLLASEMCHCAFTIKYILSPQSKLDMKPLFEALMESIMRFKIIIFICECVKGLACSCVWSVPFCRAYHRRYIRRELKHGEIARKWRTSLESDENTDVQKAHGGRAAGRGLRGIQI